MGKGRPFLKTIALTMLVILAGGFSGATAATAGSPADAEVLVYREISGQALEIHLFHPERMEGDEPTAAVLLFHGGGWVAGTPEWTYSTARIFASMGIAALAVEYRLSDDATTPLDALADARAAFRWTREHDAELNIDPAQVAGYGVSAGGYLAAAAATVPIADEDPDAPGSRPDLLLLWSPALDVANDGWFRKLIQGHGDASGFSPADLAGAGTPPTCIIHGEMDTLTPLAGVQKYRRAVVDAGGTCLVHVSEGVGHLLTRNLANQEDDFDPDPEKRADGREKLKLFLEQQGYAPQERDVN